MDDSFVFYASFYDAVIGITTPEAQLATLKAVIEYGLGRSTKEDFPGLCYEARLLMPTFATNIDSAKKRHDINRENGMHGGRPRKADRFHSENQTKPLGFSSGTKEDIRFQTENLNVNDNDNDNDNETANTNAVWFEELWTLYPKHSRRDDAFEAFQKLSPDRGTVEQIKRAIVGFKLTEGWKKDNGQYIPSMCNFIYDERWKGFHDPDGGKPNFKIIDRGF